LMICLALNERTGGSRHDWPLERHIDRFLAGFIADPDDKQRLRCGTPRSNADVRADGCPHEAVLHDWASSR
jgi:hypothetical protein